MTALIASVLAALAALPLASAQGDNHGLDGGQIVIIASVAILGIVCLVISAIVGCVTCAKMDYRFRERRRMMEEEGGLVLGDTEEQEEEEGTSYAADSAPQPSGSSTNSAYFSLPSEDSAPPGYAPRDTPLEVLRVKNMLFNHHK